jgi:RNA polymerase sigma-70 factor (ECF subfamily)
MAGGPASSCVNWTTALMTASRPGSWHVCTAAAATAGAAPRGYDGNVDTVLSPDTLRACLERRLDQFYRVARSLTGSHADAEDAVHDAVVRAMRARAGFRGEADVCTWVHRIVVNSCHDVLRRRGTEQRRVDALRIEGQWSDPAYSVDPAEVAAALSDADRLRATLGRLSEAQRTVVVLHDVEQWTTEDIAEVLDMPRATVKSHLRRGRHALVTLLGEAS